MKRCCTRLVGLTLAGICVFLLSVPELARADNPEMDATSFRPSLHPGDIFGIRTTTMPKQWDWGIGLWFTYQYKPLRLTFDHPQLDDVSVLRHQFTTDLYGHVAFTDWFDVALDLPFVFVSKGDGPPALLPGIYDQVGGAMLGDMRLALKFRILGGNGQGWGFGISEDLTFPTATKDNFAGDANVTSTTRLIADYSKNGWNAALNVGFRFREPVTIFGNKISHQFVYGLGLSAPAICGTLEVLASIEGHTSMTNTSNKDYQNLLDLMAGLRWYPGHDLALTAMAGGGVLKGYGSPKFRGAINLTYSPKPLEKGCEVPLDSDGDGILDEDDACPAEPGPVENGGCPLEPDADGDGIADSKDACPKTPGVAKYSGCPDTDGDGIPDIDDKCPEEPGVAEHQGCPPPPVVSKIVIAEKIYFDFDKATIKRKSFSILKELAIFMKDNPQLKKIEVQGHTDSKGSEEYNMKLSMKRAKSVKRFLVKKGVKAKRLIAKGFGPKKPIADNATDAGRAENRRVEFLILD